MKVYLSDHREQGFFSSVNLILMGIRNLLNSGVENYYIDWKNRLYQNDNENLFDKNKVRKNAIIPDRIIVPIIIYKSEF